MARRDRYVVVHEAEGWYVDSEFGVTLTGPPYQDEEFARDFCEMMNMARERRLEKRRNAESNGQQTD